jgi:hypothetical protein
LALALLPVTPWKETQLQTKNFWAEEDISDTWDLLHTHSKKSFRNNKRKMKELKNGQTAQMASDLKSS